MDRTLDSFFGAPARSRPGLLARLAAAAEMRRSRAALRALDGHLLRDVGLTRAEALAEADRPIWDAPAHWLR